MNDDISKGRARLAALVLCAATPSAACAQGVDPGPETTRTSMTQAAPVKTPADRFATLDDYLAYLRKQSTMDTPYYVEVSPGVFQLAAGRRKRSFDPPPPTYTREDLELKFGFRKQR